MKEVTAKKLPSGNYRIQPMIRGKRVSITFDHNPTKGEIKAAIEAAEVDRKRQEGISEGCDRFEDAYKIYIDSKRNVLSPSTLRGYDILFRHMPESFKQKKIFDINNLQVQKLINTYSADHSAKTVRNLSGLVSAVLKMADPELKINVTLPAKQIKSEYVPTDEDIRRILEMAKGTKYEIPFQLATFGLRRGEILALTINDLDGNFLTIDKAMVEDKSRKWSVKPTPKTVSSNRRVYIPDELRDLILENGCIFEGFPNTLYVTLTRYQDKLGIPHFSFHKLRHYFASSSHGMGLSDADIMAMGGWQTDHIMKTVYRHAREESVSEGQRLYAEKMARLVSRNDFRVVESKRKAKQA